MVHRVAYRMRTRAMIQQIYCRQIYSNQYESPKGPKGGLIDIPNC